MIPEHPFAPGHTRETFLETSAGREALDRLMDGPGAREPFLLLTGEPGTGKTALVNELLARWGSRVSAAFVAYPALAGVELLEEIVRRFGHEPPEGAGRPRLMAVLERALAEVAARGQVAVVVVDDAHDLPDESLEELRLLANAAQSAQRPLEVLLAGLPSLAARLDAPERVALRQRVSVRASVAPFSGADTQRYLHHRVTAAGGDGPGLFARRTCREIAAHTGGVARRINTLAAEALREARASEDPTVTPEHVEAAARALGSAGVALPPAVAQDTERAPAPPATAADAPRPPAPAPPPASVATDTPLAALRAHVRSAEMSRTPYDEPRPTVPATHDAHEWVARFIGDQGPVQIGARACAYVEPTWTPEPSGSESPESSEAEAAPVAEPARMARGRHAHSPWRRRRGPGTSLTMPLMVIAVLGAVAFLMRSGDLARRALPQGMRASATATAPRAVAAAPRAARVAAPAPAAPPAASPPATLAAPAPVEVTLPPVPGEAPANDARRYTIDVGGFLDAQRALDARDRLREATGIEAWVVPGDGSERGTYRIVLGIFRTPERATTAASVLISEGRLEMARVVPLPPRSVRQ